MALARKHVIKKHGPDLHMDDYGNILAITGELIHVIGPVDEYDRPVKRTKFTHPYNYDGFVLHRFGKNEEANGTIYSDRLYTWDHRQHDMLCKKHFGNRGQYWNERNPQKIEAFLRDWCEDPELKLVLVMEYCNQASGYPCWRFDYKVGPTKDERYRLDRANENPIKFEICSVCHCVYEVHRYEHLRPHLYIDNISVPTCDHCKREHFDTEFRMVFDMKIGTARTNRGDQRNNPDSFWR